MFKLNSTFIVSIKVGSTPAVGRQRQLNRALHNRETTVVSLSAEQGLAQQRDDRRLVFLPKTCVTKDALGGRGLAHQSVPSSEAVPGPPFGWVWSREGTHQEKRQVSGGDSGPGS